MISLSFHESKRKAQVSLEFMFYITAILLAITIYSFVLYTRYDLTEKIKENNLQEFLSRLSDMIQYVYMQGDGFYLNHTFPQKISNKDYILTYSNNLIVVDIQNVTYTQKLTVSEINITVIPGKKHRIENKKGVIYVFPY